MSKDPILVDIPIDNKDDNIKGKKGGDDPKGSRVRSPIAKDSTAKRGGAKDTGRDLPDIPKLEISANERRRKDSRDDSRFKGEPGGANWSIKSPDNRQPKSILREPRERIADDDDNGESDSSGVLESDFRGTANDRGKPGLWDDVRTIRVDRVQESYNGTRRDVEEFEQADKEVERASRYRNGGDYPRGRNSSERNVRRDNERLRRERKEEGFGLERETVWLSNSGSNRSHDVFTDHRRRNPIRVQRNDSFGDVDPVSGLQVRRHSEIFAADNARSESDGRDSDIEEALAQLLRKKTEQIKEEAAMRRSKLIKIVKQLIDQSPSTELVLWEWCQDYYPVDRKIARAIKHLKLCLKSE